MQLNIRNRQVEKWSFWSSYSALFRNELRLYFTYIVHTLCLYSMSKICKQRAEDNNVILFIFKGVSFTICNIQFDPHKSGTKKLQSRSLTSYSTLYTAVPHWKLKDRFKGPTVFHEKYLVLGRDISYFVKKKNTLILPKCFPKLIFEFLIDNIFVVIGGHVFQQTVGIPMGTNCINAFSHQLFLFEWGRLHTGTSQEKWKEASPIL